MTRPRTARFALLAIIAASTLVATGCAGSPDSGEAATSAPASAAPASPATTPEPTETTATVAAASCENIISPSALDSFEAEGWTVEEEQMTVAAVTLADGISCTWTNAEQAGGNILIFGWSPITAEQAAQAEQSLESDGWTSESTDEGLMVTIDPNMAITVDDDGFGETYLFGDGWVIMAGTKQNLMLVDRRAPDPHVRRFVEPSISSGTNRITTRSGFTLGCR